MHLLHQSEPTSTVELLAKGVKVDLRSPKLTIFTLSYPVFTVGIASITVKVPVALEAILKCDFGSPSQEQRAR